MKISKLGIIITLCLTFGQSPCSFPGEDLLQETCEKNHCSKYFEPLRKILATVESCVENFSKETPRWQLNPARGAYEFSWYGYEHGIFLEMLEEGTKLYTPMGHHTFFFKTFFVDNEKTYDPFSEYESIVLPVTNSIREALRESWEFEDWFYTKEEALTNSTPLSPGAENPKKVTLLKPKDPRFKVIIPTASVVEKVLC